MNLVPNDPRFRVERPFPEEPQLPVNPGQDDSPPQPPLLPPEEKLLSHSGLTAVVAAFFLCLGLLLLGLLPLVGGACLVMSGVACGLSLKDVLSSQPLFVRCVLGLMMVGCLFTTWICFEQPGILMLFPGFTVAFASGQLVGVFIRHFLSLRRNRKDA
jgi:hypothetical protein